MRSTYGQTPAQIKESEKALQFANAVVPDMVGPRRKADPGRKKKTKTKVPQNLSSDQILALMNHLEKRFKQIEARQRSSHTKLTNEKPSESTAERKHLLEHGLVHGHAVHMHLLGLEDPFGAGVDARSTICRNPAPSFLSASGKITFTDDNIVVAAGATMQFVFFPGHGNYANFPAGVGGSNTPSVSSTDPVAFHDLWQYVGGTTAANRFPIGPCETEAISGSASWTAPILGVKASLTLGQFTDKSDAAGFSTLAPDMLLPYYSAGEQIHGEHLRHQLVNMGIKITNTTLGGVRGGNVVTVQPDLTMLPAPGKQSTLKFYRSYRNWGVGEKMITVNWLPRSQDMAFWHTAAVEHANAFPSTTSSHLNGGAIFIFLNNTSSSPQTYTIEAIQNFQIAGAQTASVATPNPVVSKAQQGIVENVTSLARQAGASAKNIVGMATKVSSAIATGKSILSAAGFI